MQWPDTSSVRSRWSLPAAVAALALLVGGCDWYYTDVPSPDDLMHVIPWFDHMIYSRAVHPYSRADIPRNTVDGTVPVTGGEKDWSLEWAAAKTTTADALQNPTVNGVSGPEVMTGAAVPRLPGTLDAKGDTLFQTYCALCHGEAGAGNGLVGRKIGAPSLLTARARAYTDGYVYSIVRYGRGLMPRYGDKVYEPIDRWAIVNRVRKLQAAAPAEPPAPGGPK